MTPAASRPYLRFATREALRRELTAAACRYGPASQRVEVVSRNEAHIRGLRSELLRTPTAASGVEAAVLGVRAFEPKWRSGQEETANQYVIVGTI